MMNDRTSLSELLSGAQEYLKLEAKALRLKTFLTATDAGYNAVRTAAVVIAGCIATVFLGISLALWLGTLFTPAAGFAICGLLFLLTIPAMLMWFRRTQTKNRDRLISVVAGEPSVYADVKAGLQSVEIAKKQQAEELSSQLLRLKNKAEKLENFLAPGAGEQPGIAGNLIKSAAGNVIRYALMPKAGIIGKVIAPAIAGALLRSSPVKRLAGRFLSKKKK